MVKSVELQAYVEACTAQDVYDMVYRDEGPMRKYHQAVNKNPTVEVTPWDNGVRQVTFEMPIALPQFLKSTFGADVVRVEEKQSVLWHSATHFSVTSETTLENVPGASRFATVLLMHVIEDKNAVASSVAAAELAGVVAERSALPDVLLKYSVKCSAGLPWPMSVSVENIMVEKAQASLSSFLDFVSQLVRDLTAGAFPAAAEADTARASVAPVGHRLRRWPTAIAISSVQELDLEVPLLQGAIEREASTAGSDFQDAAEAWASPSSRSGSTTPFAPNMRASSQSLDAARVGKPPADIQQLLLATAALQQSVARLERNVALILRNMSTSPVERPCVFWRGLARKLVWVLVISLLSAGVVLLVERHGTGLFPPQPPVASYMPSHAPVLSRSAGRGFINPTIAASDVQQAHT